MRSMFATSGVLALMLLSNAHAQIISLPTKTTWSLAGGGDFDGRALGYNYRLLVVQRRRGELMVNGAKVEKPSDDPLLVAVCQLNNIPITDGRALQATLAKQRGAQAIVPYYTLRYSPPAGGESEVPVALLAGGDIAELRPSFDAWLAEKQREYQEQMFRLQELANQQQIMSMQQEQLRAQQSMMQASWAQVRATESGNAEMRRQTEELRRLNDAVR